MIDQPAAAPYVEVGLSSTGISKGLAQTDGPQIEVATRLSLGALSIDGYGKNVQSSSDDGVEWGASIGFEHEIQGVDVSLSAGLKTLSQIVSEDRTALELEAEASRSFGPIEMSASGIYSPDDTGATGRALFLEVGLTWEIAERTRVGAAVGRRERDGSTDYTAFNAGASFEPSRNLTVDVRYYVTSRGGDGDPFRPGLVAEIRARF